MYFKLSKGSAKKWLLLSYLLTSLQPSLAAELTEEQQSKQSNAGNKLSLSNIIFSAQPANCIALRHGRTCYANVTLSWTSRIKQDYCLYIKQVKNKQTHLQMLKCWVNSNGNQLRFDFESNKKIEFQLRSTKNKQIIAETAVDVSWVHKATPRKRRWRIF